MRLFIFDMGGVVTANVQCIPDMAASLGMREADFFRGAGSDPDAATRAEAPTSPYNLGDVGALMRGAITPERFWAEFNRRTGSAVRGDLWRDFFRPLPDAGVYAAIEALKAAGFRVVCGTNSLDAHYKVHVEEGHYACFHEVYASHLMGLIKPAPAFWRRILDAEGCPAEEAFFIDDHKENVDAARALGLSVHLFKDAAGLRADLASWIGAA
jgi:putative hydrolase of the HAD superfamily